MFLEQGVKKGNKFWKYIIGYFMGISGTLLGWMLMMLLIFLRSLSPSDQLPEGISHSLGYLSPNLTLILIGTGYCLATCLLFLIVKYLHGQKIQSVISARKKTDWKRILFAFLVSLIFWVIMQASSIYFDPEGLIPNFRPIPFLILFIVTTFAVVVRSFFEQYLYRGYLMQGFANLSGNHWFPLLIVAVIHAIIYAIHPEVTVLGFFEMFSTIFIYYLFLGILTLMDEGIELPVGFHAAHMLITHTFYTSEKSSLRTDALFIELETEGDTFSMVDMLVPYLIIIPIFLFICSKKYNWNGWKEKLTGKIVRS